MGSAMLKGDEMTNRVLASLGGAMFLVGLVLSAAAPAAAQAKAPRTSWGKPDLQGTWDFRTITPLERPDNMAGKEFLSREEAENREREVVNRNNRLDARPAERTTAGGSVDIRADGSPGFYNNFWLDYGTKTISTRRTSLIIDPPNGKLPPVTARAKQQVEATRKYLTEHPADSWLDRSTSDRCILGFNAGPPLTPGGYNQNVQLFQTQDYVALVTEMIHTARIVPLDGRPQLKESVRQWSGDSRGRWEGDTLVVETSNFVGGRNAWTLPLIGEGTDFADQPAAIATPNMKLVERFTRLDADTLEYKYTVIDPEVWTREWTAAIPLRRSDSPMYEYACHEGNYSMPNILSGQRALEKAASSQR
ncbi:MAG: hypothetical protein DMF89_12325 [Acidobacteria bacterium]|nr:MAG: hypothetical protein DMF90_13940 [Acidobacteriota bacterium]PYR49515.1 MAG: hypothetical protein DMF89_12325 [Acidobacteriota bacterium]